MLKNSHLMLLSTSSGLCLLCLPALYQLLFQLSDVFEVKRRLCF